MKTTIQKNVIYGYLGLGGLMFFGIFLSSKLRTPSENVFGNLDNAISQLVLEVYALYGFGLIVLFSSALGCWLSFRKKQMRYQRTFQICFVFALVYFIFLFLLGYEVSF